MRNLAPALMEEVEIRESPPGDVDCIWEEQEEGVGKSMLQKEKRAPRPGPDRGDSVMPQMTKSTGTTVSTAAKRSSKISSGKEPQTAGPSGPHGFSTVREDTYRR